MRELLEVAGESCPTRSEIGEGHYWIGAFVPTDSPKGVTRSAVRTPTAGPRRARVAATLPLFPTLFFTRPTRKIFTAV